MLILALESSAKAASVALMEDDKLIAQYSQCSGLTHSRTLLPMVDDMLKNTENTIAGVDLIAVAHGPGSFTGIRIGVSTVKGLAWAADKMCVGVSTLEAMAWHGVPAGGIICPVMDARRSQVYNALFEIKDGKPVRLCDDRAIALSELAGEIRGKNVFLVGDGAFISEVERYGVADQRLIVVVGQKHPSFCFVAFVAGLKKISFVVKFYLIWLLNT